MKTMPLAVLTIVAGGVIGGCASASVTSPSSAAATSVCQNISRVDRLDAKRTDALPQNQSHFTFAADISTSDATQVQVAAQALCALPAMPTGAIFCPADFGITYQLTFDAGATQFPTVTVDPSGCQTVRGLGTTVAWATTSPGFWPTLGAALGLPHPTAADFAGTRPG
jgi:hypothetical protein